MLCLVEALERYGNFLIAALLPLFLNEQKRMAPGSVLRLVGYYLALGYASGVVGGWLADRWLGYRGATRVGALFLMLGAALLTSTHPRTLYPALALMIAGSGCFKPALSAWLGTLYAANDPRGSAGFAWLYVAANVGAALAPFVGGALHIRYSWPVAFATTAGAFALCLGMIVVSQTSAPPSPKAVRNRQDSAAPDADDAAAPYGRTLSVLLLVVLLFTVSYGQSGGVMLFFARDRVDRTVFGHVVPPDFFAAIPSAFVIVFIVLQQVLIKTFFRRHRPPAPATQILIGMLASGVAFGLLSAVAAAHSAKSAPQLISALWIIAALAFLTLGEVLVIPVAMAQVSQVAPRRWGALAQGGLAAAMAGGLALSGEVGRFFTEWGAGRFFAATAVMPLVGALALVTVGRPPPPRPAAP